MKRTLGDLVAELRSQLCSLYLHPDGCVSLVGGPGFMGDGMSTCTPIHHLADSPGVDRAYGIRLGDLCGIFTQIKV